MTAAATLSVVSKTQAIARHKQFVGQAFLR
jgi:hypothetical protein